MAFATKYQLTFHAVDNQHYDILFQVDGWGGAITYFTPGPNPLQMTYAGYERNQTIVGSSAEIQVVYESTVDALFVEADRVIRVYVYSTGTNGFLWWGYISPFQYYRKLGTAPHYASFMATDQLGLLSNKKFEHLDGDQVYYIDSEMSHLQIISDRAGLDLSIRDGINIYDSNFDSTAGDSPLTQVFWHPEQYWNEVTDERTDCHTVLTDTLKKYNARICQWDLEWWIQRPQTLWSDHTTRQFNAAGTYLSDATEYRKWVMQTSGGVWLATPEIMKIPRVGKVNVTAMPRRFDNVLKNSTFDYFTQVTDGGNVYYWTTNSAITEQDGYLDIGSTTSTSAKHLETTVTYSYCNSARLIIEFKAVWHATNSEAKMNIRLYSPLSTNYYTTTGWGSSAANYVVDLYAGTGGTSMTEYGELAIEIPLEDGVAYLGLYQSLTIELHDLKVDTTTTDSTIYIRTVRLEPDYESGAPTEFLYSATNAVESLSVIDETLTQVDADASIFLAQRGIYPGDSYSFLQKSVTKDDNIYEWFIVGHPALVATPQSIQQLYATQVLEAAYTPVDQIQGTLRGYYNYTKALVDTDLVDSHGFPKTFIGQNLVWDCRRLEWNGTWMEIAPIYTDVTESWSGIAYADWALDGAELDVESELMGDTNFARTTAYTAVAGEMVRFVVTITNSGGSDLPNYSFDTYSGVLAWGVNYLEFRCATAGNYYLEVNHTVGETAHFVATYAMYSLTGI